MAVPMTVSRESIAAALFSVVSTAAGSVVGLVTSSRRVRMPTDVSPSEMPALFQAQVPEDYEHTQGGMLNLQAKRTMNFELGLFVYAAQENTVVPSTQLNDMIDAIEAAFAPDCPTVGSFTLGGLVSSARISGKIGYFENFAGDGISVATIPIAVMRP